jgi:hypothetical protein
LSILPILDVNLNSYLFPFVSRKHAAFFIGTGNKMICFGGIDKENNTRGDLNVLDTNDEEVDVLDAFVAMGGNADTSGSVNIDKLTAQLVSYGLTIDLAGLMSELDEDGSGDIEYEEFVQLMTSHKEALELANAEQSALNASS